MSHLPTGWVSSTGIGETQSVDRATACACSEPEQNATELIAPDRPAVPEIPEDNDEFAGTNGAGSPPRS